MNTSRRSSVLTALVVLTCAFGVRAETELVVSADTTLHASATYSGIRFTGGHTLSADDGVTVQIADGGGIAVASGKATLACSVQFGATTDGETIDAYEAPIAVAEGATLVCSASACLSGDAKIVVGHPGTVEMRADNTFNGTFLLTNGFFAVYSDGAFGTTRGKTIYDCTDRTKGKVCLRFYGVTMTDDFDYNCADIDATAYFHTGANSTTNYLNGKQYAYTKNFRWQMGAGAWGQKRNRRDLKMRRRPQMPPKSCHAP